MKYTLPKSAIIAIAIGILFKPIIYPFLITLKASKYDEQVGRIQPKSLSELQSIYKKKKVLIIGGTRGVGRGIALTVGKAGADVTVVGRSENTGEATLHLLNQQQQEARTGQRIDYVQGDIGSVRSAKECVKSLSKYASRNGKFDYVFVTAAIFPYWDDLMNEDGLERSFGIAVIGRYMIYNNLKLILKPESGRMLNVLAAGMDDYPFDLDLASGSTTNGSFFQYVMNFACGNEMMMIGLRQRNKFYSNVTRVSTHPGMLKTDLHRGQGWWLDVLEGVLVKLIGFTEEEAGIRQASILASSQLVEGRLNYVDEFLKGRLLGSKVPVDDHLDWLMDLIDSKMAKKK